MPGIQHDALIFKDGARTLPEGGYYSVLKLYTDNALIVGDSAGLVVMPALKGVHLAVGVSGAIQHLLFSDKNKFF